MIIEAMSDDKKGNWLLDTGSSHNLVSKDFVEYHGLKLRSSIKAVTAQGQLRAPRVNLPPLQFGSPKQYDQKALVVDLESVVGVVGNDLDGILGVPFFEEFELSLDLHNWVAEIRDDKSSGCPTEMTSVSLGRYQGLPVMKVVVNDGNAEFVLLDTGNPAGLIRILSSLPSSSKPSISLPGPSRLNLAQQVRFGNQVRLNVPVVQLQAPALKRALGDRISGLAGTALLDGTRLIIDLSRNRACFENGSFNMPGGFGLTLEKRNGTMHIGTVLAGGPAQLAGLKDGETIQRWAGGSASSTLQEMWARVQGLDEIEMEVGQEARIVRLRRAYYAPLLQ